MCHVQIKFYDHSLLFYQSLKKLAIAERLIFGSWGHASVVVAVVERWPS